MKLHPYAFSFTTDAKELMNAGKGFYAFNKFGQS